MHRRRWLIVAMCCCFFLFFPADQRSADVKRMNSSLVVWCAFVRGPWPSRSSGEQSIAGPFMSRQTSRTDALRVDAITATIAPRLLTPQELRRVILAPRLVPPTPRLPPRSAFFPARTSRTVLCGSRWELPARTGIAWGWRLSVKRRWGGHRRGPVALAGVRHLAGRGI